MTRAPRSCASLTVSSVLPLSTTRTSSAHPADARQASMFVASLRVMTVTVSFGTAPTITQREPRNRRTPEPEPRNSGTEPRNSGTPEPTRLLSDLLHPIERDQRAGVRDLRIECRGARLRQVTLPHLQIERRPDAHRKALLLGAVLFIEGLERDASGQHPLVCVLDLTGRFADVERNGQFEVAKGDLLLVLLDLVLRERRLRGASAERVANSHAHRPVGVRTAE